MEINKIHHCDCFEGLSEIEDDTVDLVILDPPYDEWDSFLENGIICESVRILKPTGNLICFTKQPFDFNLRNDIEHIFRREIVWTFTNGGAWVSRRMPLVSFQKIYWCTPTKDFYFNERTGVNYNTRTADFKRSKKVFGEYEAEGRKFVKSEKGIWLRDHLHFNKPQNGKIPAKPQELIRILVNCFCPPDGVVVDPFMGSGTTAIVCMETERKFVGFEINKEYCDKANARMSNNINLFNIQLCQD